MTEMLGLIRELLEVEKEKAKVERRTDSIDIGTPSKGGALKVYFDASNPDEARTLIDEAVVVRKYAQDALARSAGESNAGV